MGVRAKTNRTEFFEGTLSGGAFWKKNPPGLEPLTIKRTIGHFVYTRTLNPKSPCQGLTPTEAAKYFRVRRGTIYDWIWAKKIRTIKVHGRLLIPVREVYRVKENQKGVEK